MEKLTLDSKIVLVELPATEFGQLLTTEDSSGQLSSDVYRYFQVPPRAIPLITAELMELGFKNLQMIDPIYHGENGKLTKQNLDDIMNADALAVSAISRTSNQSIALMNLYKKFKPEGIGLFGGTHFSARVDDGLIRGNADVVVMWEGDLTLEELFKRFLENPNNLENIRGIAYKNEGQIKISPKRRLLTPEELDKLPQPFYDKAIREKTKAAVVSTSRGCPWACNFCIVSECFGREYRRPSIEHVIEAARQVEDMGKSVFYIDDNLPGESEEDRNYCKDLLRRLETEGLNRRNSLAQFSIHAARDRELLQLAKEAGIDYIAVGVESLNDSTLRKLKKPATAKRNIEACKIYTEHNIGIHGMKMPLGDGDTSESLDEESEKDKELFLTVQYFPTGPIPGTEFERQMYAENRLLPIDYAYGSGDYVLVRPKNFTPYGGQIKVRELYDRFYTEDQAQKARKAGAGGLIMYRIIRNGIKDMLNSLQMQKHLEFLKQFE